MFENDENREKTFAPLQAVNDVKVDINKLLSLPDDEFTALRRKNGDNLGTMTGKAKSNYEIIKGLFDMGSAQLTLEDLTHKMKTTSFAYSSMSPSLCLYADDVTSVNLYFSRLHSEEGFAEKMGLKTQEQRDVIEKFFERSKELLVLSSTIGLIKSHMPANFHIKKAGLSKEKLEFVEKLESDYENINIEYSQNLGLVYELKQEEWLLP